MWRTKLKTSGYATVSVNGSRVYAGAGGEVFCLDIATGEILWRNSLKGLGLGIVAFSGGSDAIAAASAAAAAAAGSAA
jgi:outer membrane protein assembly factor BamB